MCNGGNKQLKRNMKKHCEMCLAVVTSMTMCMLCDLSGDSCVKMNRRKVTKCAQILLLEILLLLFCFDMCYSLFAHLSWSY